MLADTLTCTTHTHICYYRYSRSGGFCDAWHQTSALLYSGCVRMLCVCVWERLTGGFVLEERESLFEMNIFFVCRSFSYEKSYSWSITYSWGFCWGFSLSSFPPSLHPLFSQLMLKQSHWTQINSSLLILFEIGYWVCVWCSSTKRRLKVKVQWI